MNGDRHPLALKRVVYRIPDMESAPVRRDVAYSSSAAGALTMDLYYPRQAMAVPHAPVVVLVTGYPDVGVPRPLGCAFKDMEMTVSLAQLIAASGLAAAAYTSRAPIEDIRTLLEHLTANAGVLLVDSTRIGLWAVSGHGPTALSMLAWDRSGMIRAVVLSTAYTLDLEGSVVADAARTYGFANAASGLAASDLPGHVPLFVARAGRDEFPGLNDALDGFVATAVRQNLPVTAVNHATAGHAFEINDDSAASRHVVEQMLGFMRFWLTA